MSQDNQEPRISLALDDDEIVHRKARKNSSPPPSSSDSGSGGGGGGFLSFLLTILVLALGGAAYYLYDQLTLAQGQLAQSQQRLDALEDRLSAAGENLEENSVTTQVKLQELDSEVRKLWDNVWKKQKEELEKNSADLDKAEKRLAALEGKQKSSDAALSKVTASFNADRDSLKSMGSKVDKALAQSDVNRRELLTMSAKLDTGGSLAEKVKALDAKVAQNTEWQDSVDAFRRQINRDIENLRQTITQYHSASPAPR